MRRRELIAATGTVAAAAVTGCLASADEGDDPSQTDPAGASGTGRTIVVSSSGEAEDGPDLAVLQLGVEATGDTAQAVRDDLSTRSDDLREALLDYGVDEEDITTRHYRIRERIDRRRMEADGVRPDSREEAEEYIHYQGTHSFTVEIDDIDEVGDVIDAAVDGGADEVGRVTFTLSDEKRADLREEALREAIGNAREEADTIADEIGAAVVEATVVDASEGRVTPVRRHVGYAGDAAAATPTPETAPATGVEPGDVTVSADVRVEYRMA